MFEHANLLSFLSGLGQVAQQAWIGAFCPNDAVWYAVDLFKRPGFRATPDETNRFDRVVILQAPVHEQGWRLLIDSSLRMLKPHGTLVVRYVQNRYVTIPALKNFIFRKYGITASVCDELAEGVEVVTAFYVQRQLFTQSDSRSWTFGILTQGKKSAVVERMCSSVRVYGGDAHEILVVGPPDPSYEAHAPIYIEQEFSQRFSDICIKKNALVSQASHENICIVHDRYWLNADFFTGFEDYGYDFDFLTVRQHHESGKNYPSYCAIDDRSNLIWGNIYECGNENQTWVRNYLNGGLIIAKKDLLTKVPFNELIFHAQAEDVELARQMAAHSVLPRINRLSSAVTDVPDHLTDAFTFAPTSDYEQIFFPSVPSLPSEQPLAQGANSSPLADMAPTVEASETLSPAVDRPPWVRFSGILHKIERRRLMGASWKEVIFLSAKFAYFRMLRRSRISSTPRHDIQLAESTTAEPAPEPAPSVFAQRPPEEAEGVNIMLYAGDPGGVLNVSSYYIRSLIRKNVPVAIVDIEQGAVSNALPHDLNVFLHPAPIYPINVWCIGFPFLSHHIATFHDWTENRWNVNFTHWELPYVPRRLWDNFKAVDAIIVDSEFVQSAIQDATDKPIILVDPEVEIPAFMIDRYDRAHFGLPDSKVLFLLNWEFTSSTIRKNPEASIKAFSEAFDDLRRDVALVMHVKFEFRHGEDQRANYEAFIAQIKRVHSNIIVLEKNSYTYDEALALKSLCDCYVSLHRAEGYGMGCAEALALGRRCVMTGWSGNMELLKNPRWRDMAFPVAVALVPVTPEDYPWVDSEDEVMQLWADPRHGDAVRQLKRAYEAIISTQEMT